MGGYQRVAGRGAAARASIVVTVSEASKRRIVERLRVDPDRVTVTHEAARPLFRQVEDEARTNDVLRNRRLERPFVLALGSGDPRKNVAALLEVFAAVRTTVGTCTLVVVTNYAPLESELAAFVRDLGVSPAVRFLTGVTDEELVTLYNAAEVFVHPSLEEGFGLPLLEAMACGTPVVAFDNSSIPEVAGGAAMLVPTGSVEAMSRRIVEVLGDAGLRQRLAARGLERAAQFSWERCARETIAAYMRALGGGAGA
jgi:glycosyltransferase involved in cell wall biosynthesis